MIVRAAVPAERAALIELQRRASLANPGDRDALLAHPDVVDTPLADGFYRRLGFEQTGAAQTQFGSAWRYVLSLR